MRIEERDSFLITAAAATAAERERETEKLGRR